MAERLFERAGGFASHLGLLAGRGVKQAVVDLRESAQRRALAQRAARAEQERVREQELLAVEAALPRFRAELADALEVYAPVLSQADVDATDWQVPREAAELLQAELVRIRAIVTPLMRSAGFPLQSADEAVRARMTGYWEEAWAAFERKAFARLSLPSCFEFVDGRIGFERVSGPVRESNGRWSYVGEKTGYYYVRPPVLSVPEAQ